MNQLTRLAIQGYLDNNMGRHPSTVLAIPFTLAEWEAILKDSPDEAEGEWVDARTRKPPPTFDVLIDGACGMDIGNWTGHYWIEASTHDVIEFVTHWRALPPSPSDIEER